MGERVKKRRLQADEEKHDGVTSVQIQVYAFLDDAAARLHSCYYWAGGVRASSEEWTHEVLSESQK